MIRIVLPFHLRNLAKIDGGEVTLEIRGGDGASGSPAAPLTLGQALDALEARYPVLRGTIRDHGTLQRRPFLRYFCCQMDYSHEPPDTPLPESVARGDEPLLIVGAIAGG